MYFLLLLLVSLTTAMRHPIHISLCEINHNAATRQVEITHKIFIDDLQDAIQKHYHICTHLATPKEHPDAEKLIEQYLRMQFQCKINGQPIRWKYVGREYEADACWIYLEAEQALPIHLIEIRNAVLLELFEDQINFIHVRTAGERKSMRLGLDNEIGVLRF
ncbi:MAG: hypothetical protein RMJ87_13740 [Cytophagales bacterium]|nr:hypothetical protein [Bernardetiaceae bacterium]MDW8206085.1 hypothetical protein [Cytophagales bacterium]